MTTNDLVTRNAEAKKKKKYLPLYYLWLKDDSMFKYLYKGSDPVSTEGCGLCGAMCRAGIPTEIVFKQMDLFQPPDEDIDTIKCYPWYGGEMGKFTKLRQNILLFLAAMNNEL